MSVLEYWSRTSTMTNNIRNPSNRAEVVTGRLRFIWRPLSRIRNALRTSDSSSFIRSNRQAITHAMRPEPRRRQCQCAEAGRETLCRACLLAKEFHVTVLKSAIDRRKWYPISPPLPDFAEHV